MIKEQKTGVMGYKNIAKSNYQASLKKHIKTFVSIIFNLYKYLTCGMLENYRDIEFLI